MIPPSRSICRRVPRGRCCIHSTNQAHSCSVATSPVTIKPACWAPSPLLQPDQRGSMIVMATTVLNVPDISCEHCERAITNALTPVEGVRTVTVDIPAKQVHVDYDDATVNIDRMKEILNEEEYPVESVA